MESNVKFCKNCHKLFSAAGKRADRDYCSNACRQAFWRRRHAEPINADEKRKRHQERILATKRGRVHEMRCKVCGRVMSIDGTQARRMYCSNACKQRACEAKRAKGPGRELDRQIEGLEMRLKEDLRLLLERGQSRQGSFEDLRDFIVLRRKRDEVERAQRAAGGT